MSDIFRIKPPRRSAWRIAAHGMVHGGRLNGSLYAFERISFTPRGAMLVHVVLGEPNWPFPRPAALARGDFASLRPVPGARAPRIEVMPLVTAAQKS